MKANVLNLTGIGKERTINCEQENEMPNIGIWELLVVLLIIVLLFGARKLPEIGRGLGEGIRNFKNSIKEGTKKDSNNTASQPPSKDQPS